MIADQLPSWLHPDAGSRITLSGWTWSMPVREYPPQSVAIWSVLPAVVRAGDLAWGADPVLVIGPPAAPAAAGRPYPDLIATRAAAGHVPAAADWGI
jgi:hypothetical protein